jgi:hypothetical protein
MKNEGKTRVVRVYAQDLAQGDVLVTAERDPLGVIWSEPEIDYAGDRITFMVRQTGGSVEVSSSINRVHRIEIARPLPLGGATR